MSLPLMTSMIPLPALVAQRLFALGCSSAILCLVASAQADFQGSTHLMPFDEDTINYSKTKATGAVTHLQERIDQGQTKLEYEATYGYLRSLLSELNVSTNSQMLVFSKTSFQRERISPQHPRALFFNDHVYIGFVPGSPMLEVSEADPRLGGVFYTLDQTRVEKPKL